MSVSQFADLPLADRDRHWDGAAAEKRIREFTGAQDEPNGDYRSLHVWYDADKQQNFGAYKLLIADVVNDKVVAVPRAVIAAAGIVDGSRGGIDVPADDVPRIKGHLARYYQKMGDTPPWES